MQILNKSLISIIIALALLASCGGRPKNNTPNSISKSNYINVIPNSSNDSVSMYTDDGHIFLYTTDSIGDYVVFYAKFDCNTPSRYDMIKDKIVRVQLDSSLQKVKSITSIHGGAFCSVQDNFCEVHCFDEQMQLHHHKDLNLQYEASSDSVSKKSEELYESYKILAQVMSAYNISRVMSDNGIDGWYNIQTALEPVRQLNQYDFIKGEKVYNNKCQRYLSKMELVSEGLNKFCCQLQHLLWQERDND